ncbi:MAG: hypothetical protein IK093_06485, partial [Ruminiclostridium sp.]|nr:hypothetical protein [Ruminiclostridium sp.]
SEGVDYINAMVMIGDNSYRMKVWSSFDETLALMREYNCETFENVFSGVVKYYIFKATSTGQYTGELKKTYMNEHGVIIPYQQPKEYRELTEEQAKALLTHSSQQTVYENSRDIYIILPISEHRSEYDGSITYLLGAGTAVQYYVTEPNCETAAEVYANAPAVSAEDITKYLGEYYY